MVGNASGRPVISKKGSRGTPRRICRCTHRVGGTGNAPTQRDISHATGYNDIVSVNYWRSLNAQQKDFDADSLKKLRFLDMVSNLGRIVAREEKKINSISLTQIGASKEM